MQAHKRRPQDRALRDVVAGDVDVAVSLPAAIPETWCENINKSRPLLLTLKANQAIVHETLLTHLIVPVEATACSLMDSLMTAPK